MVCYDIFLYWLLSAHQIRPPPPKSGTFWSDIFLNQEVAKTQCNIEIMVLLQNYVFSESYVLHNSDIFFGVL